MERIIIPDSTILIDYMLVRLSRLLKNLVVYPDRMLANLKLTGGLIYSQRLLLALVDKGAERKAAYEAVQRHAMEAWQRREDFQKLVTNDPLINSRLTAAEIQACFEPKTYLRHVDQVYRRVFGARMSGPKPAKPTRVTKPKRKLA